MSSSAIMKECESPQEHRHLLLLSRVQNKEMQMDDTARAREVYLVII